MASPESPLPAGPIERNSDGTPVGTEPLPHIGAGGESDPGYLRSLRGGSLLGQLRTAMLVLTAAPVLILAIVPFIVREGRGKLGEVSGWVYLPIVLAALLAVVVGPRVPRPMTVGRPPRQAAGTAVLCFRQAIFLRFALCDAVIILGLPLSIVSRSELPFLLGFVLGYPLLVMWALPTTGLVERIRHRLEADGAESHLWAALLSRYSPPRTRAD